MAEHRATIRWQNDSEEFNIRSYSRDHQWEFESGQSLKASAAPAFRGSEDCVDPEEAFVASLSSCHMLTFLSLCASKKIAVNHYEDNAVGFLEKNAQGKYAMTRVILKPVVGFEAASPSAEELSELHSKAHQQCFIANSVSTEITIA